MFIGYIDIPTSRFVSHSMLNLIDRYSNIEAGINKTEVYSIYYIAVFVYDKRGDDMV